MTKANGEPETGDQRTQRRLMRLLLAGVLLALGILLSLGILIAAGVIETGGNGDDNKPVVTVQTASPAYATPAPGTGTTQTGTRQTTGQGQTLPFNAGASVIGVKIVLTDGSTFNSCYIASAAQNGTVETGVIWPNQQEVALSTPCTGVPGGQPAQAAGNVPVYGQPPQPQIGHPSLYVETGVNNHTQTWSIPVDPDKILVVGGFNVDGVGGGVYKAYPGNQTVTVTVTDGFASVIKQEWGNNEFCFRVGQAVQYGWAHGTEQPLSGWTPCP